MKGTIKNLTKVFKRYQNPYLSLYNRLVKPDEKSIDFINLHYNVSKYNAFQVLQHPINVFRCGATKYKAFESNLIYFINQFTAHKDVSDEKISKIKEYLIKRHSSELDDIEYKDRNYCAIKLKNGRIIEVNTITNSLSGVAEEIPDLLTKERNHKCHIRSLEITKHLENEAYCVTGAVWDFTPKAKWLHSWVEMEHNGQMYCIENNWNAIFKKSDYYYLQNPKIIERISQKRIREDWDKILFLNHNTDNEHPFTKLYCTSPDEAIKKHEELLQEENEK